MAPPGPYATTPLPPTVCKVLRTPLLSFSLLWIVSLSHGKHHRRIKQQRLSVKISSNENVFTNLAPKLHETSMISFCPVALTETTIETPTDTQGLRIPQSWKQLESEMQEKFHIYSIINNFLRKSGGGLRPLSTVLLITTDQGELCRKISGDLAVTLNFKFILLNLIRK